MNNKNANSVRTFLALRSRGTSRFFVWPHPVQEYVIILSQACLKLNGARKSKRRAAGGFAKQYPRCRTERNEYVSGGTLRMSPLVPSLFPEGNPCCGKFPRLFRDFSVKTARLSSHRTRFYPNRSATEVRHGAPVFNAINTVSSLLRSSLASTPTTIASPYYARSLRPPKTDPADATRRVAFLGRWPPEISRWDLATGSTTCWLSSGSWKVFTRRERDCWYCSVEINPYQCRSMCCVLFSVIYFGRIKARYCDIILYKMRFNMRNSWLFPNVNSFHGERKRNLSK